MTCVPLFANYIPLVVRKIIEESTVLAFAKALETRFGMTLQELEDRQGGSHAWETAEPGFVAMKELLTTRKVDGRSFIYGSQACHADFMLVAVFEAFARGDEDVFSKGIGRDVSFQALYGAYQQWLQND